MLNPTDEKARTRDPLPAVGGVMACGGSRGVSLFPLSAGAAQFSDCVSSAAAALALSAEQSWPSPARPPARRSPGHPNGPE
jgi:hypothetical protein